MSSKEIRDIPIIEVLKEIKTIPLLKEMYWNNSTNINARQALTFAISVLERVENMGQKFYDLPLKDYVKEIQQYLTGERGGG